MIPFTCIGAVGLFHSPRPSAAVPMIPATDAHPGLDTTGLLHNIGTRILNRESRANGLDGAVITSCHVGLHDHSDR